MAKDLVTPSQNWKFLMQSRPESLRYATITSRPAAVEQKLKNFLTKWPQVRQKLPFPEMAEMRITTEHPEYRKILDEAFLLLLDGKLRNHTEIVKYLEPYKPPEPPPPPAPVRRGRAAKKEVAAKTEGAPAGQQPKKRGRKPKALATAAASPTAAPLGCGEESLGADRQHRFSAVVFLSYPRAKILQRSRGRPRSTMFFYCACLAAVAARSSAAVRIRLSWFC